MNVCVRLIVCERRANKSTFSHSFLSLFVPVKFSRKEREETLTKMAEDKWLLQEEGEISLSARSIYELEVYIREVHKDDAIICPACNALVIRGRLF